MAAEVDLNHEALKSRLAKLDLALKNTTTNSDTNLNAASLNYDGLLDAFLVLHDECSREYLSQNQCVTDFVRRYKTTAERVRCLRPTVDDFEMKSVIGRGHFGEVQLVEEKGSGEMFAMKILRKADTLSQQNISYFEEERDIMSEATSPWLTRLHFAFQDRQNLYLVMDFHPGGDLLSLLARYEDVLNEDMARFYLAEMLLAIQALHDMGYVHRDVKPENILLDRSGHVKLADFGSACLISDLDHCMSCIPVGTPDYISPEILEQLERYSGVSGSGSRRNNNDKLNRAIIKPARTQQSGRTELGETGKGDDGNVVDVSCDWWSLGVCAYEMLFGKTPFSGDGEVSKVVTYSNIMNHKESLKFEDDTISGVAVDLIRNLLCDVKTRFRFHAIVKHGFFAGINFDTIRDSIAPFVPSVSSPDDTSNFEEFDKVRNVHFAESSMQKHNAEFSGRDLPFVGFTFTPKIESNSVRGFNVCIKCGLSSDDVELLSESRKSGVAQFGSTNRGEKKSDVFQFELNASKDRERSLRAELEHGRRRERGLKAELNDAELEVERLKAKIEMRDERLGVMEREKCELEVRLATCEARLRVVEGALREEREAAEEDAGRIYTMLREVEDMNRMNVGAVEDRHGEEISELVRRLEQEHDRSVEEQEQVMRRLEQEHREQIDRLNEQVEYWKSLAEGEGKENVVREGVEKGAGRKMSVLLERNELDDVWEGGRVEGGRVDLASLTSRVDAGLSARKLNKAVKGRRSDTALISRTVTRFRASLSESLDEFSASVTVKQPEIYSGRILELFEKLRQQRDEFETLEKQLTAERDTSREQLEELRVQLSEAVCSRAAVEAAVDSLKVTHSFETAELNAQLNEQRDKTKALEKVSEQLRMVEQRKKDLQVELSEKRARIEALELRVQELEQDQERLNVEARDWRSESIVVREESEQRRRTVRDQEAVIGRLRTNVLTLEQQVRSLKCDLFEIRSVLDQSIDELEVRGGKGGAWSGGSVDGGSGGGGSKIGGSRDEGDSIDGGSRSGGRDGRDGSNREKNGNVNEGSDMEDKSPDVPALVSSVATPVKRSIDIQTSLLHDGSEMCSVAAQTSVCVTGSEKQVDVQTSFSFTTTPRQDCDSDGNRITESVSSMESEKEFDAVCRLTSNEDFTPEGSAFMRVEDIASGSDRSNTNTSSVFKSVAKFSLSSTGKDSLKSFDFSGSQLDGSLYKFEGRLENCFSSTKKPAAPQKMIGEVEEEDEIRAKRPKKYFAEVFAMSPSRMGSREPTRVVAGGGGGVKCEGRGGGREGVMKSKRASSIGGIVAFNQSHASPSEIESSSCDAGEDVVLDDLVQSNSCSSQPITPGQPQLSARFTMGRRPVRGSHHRPRPSRRHRNPQSCGLEDPASDPSDSSIIRGENVRSVVNRAERNPVVNTAGKGDHVERSKRDSVRERMAGEADEIISLSSTSSLWQVSELAEEELYEDDSLERTVTETNSVISVLPSTERVITETNSVLQLPSTERVEIKISTDTTTMTPSMKQGAGVNQGASMTPRTGGKRSLEGLIGVAGWGREGIMTPTTERLEKFLKGEFLDQGGDIIRIEAIGRGGKVREGEEVKRYFVEVAKSGLVVPLATTEDLESDDTSDDDNDNNNAVNMEEKRKSSDSVLKLQQENSRLTNQIEALRKKLDCLTNQLAGFEAMQADKDKLEEKNVKLLNQTEELRKKLDSTTNQLAGLEVLRAERDKLEQQMFGLKSLRKEKQCLAEQVESLRREKHSLANQVEELQQKNSTSISLVIQTEEKSKESEERTSNETKSGAIDSSETAEGARRVELEVEYLRGEVERLKVEVQRGVDSTHEQRLRALDLKHELREKTAESENEISELRCKLIGAETAMNQEKEAADWLRNREAELSSQLSANQKELKDLSDRLKQTTSELEETKEELGSKLNEVNSNLKIKESLMKDSDSQRQSLIDEVAELKRRIRSLESSNSSLGAELKVLSDSKDMQEAVVIKMRDEIKEKEKICESHLQQVDKLKEVALLLEDHIKDLETLLTDREKELAELQEGNKRREESLISSRDAQISRLSKDVGQLNSLLSQARLRADSTAAQMVDSEHKRSVLELEVKRLNCQIEGTNQGAQRLKNETERRLEEALRAKRDLNVQSDQLTQKLSNSNRDLEQLKSLSVELESQIKDLLELNAALEEQLTLLSTNHNSLKSTNEARVREVERLQRKLETEKQARTRSDERLRELKSQLERQERENLEELNHLRSTLANQLQQIDLLKKQVGEAEVRYSGVEIERKQLMRNIETLETENIDLKEEISREITKVNIQKRNSITLNRDLESALQKHQDLNSHNNNIQQQMEAILTRFNHDKYRMAETINQQSKLIDFLQDKMEDQPRKKKRLFKRSDGGGAQVRELQVSLDHEREKNCVLRAKLADMQDELNQARARATKLTSRLSVGESKNPSHQPLLTNQRPVGVANDPVLTKEKPGSSDIRRVPSAPQWEGSSSDGSSRTPVQTRRQTPWRARQTPGNTGVDSYKNTPTGTTRPTQGEMVTQRDTNGRTSGHTERDTKNNGQGSAVGHNNKHSYKIGRNSRPTHCIVCLGAVHFVQMAAKCEDCGAICHPRCLPDLTNDCGAPNEYVRFYKDVVTPTHGSMKRNNVKLSDLNMSGLVRVLSIDRQPDGRSINNSPSSSWQMRHIALKEDKLYITDPSKLQSTPGRVSMGNSEVLDLCPMSGMVYLESAVCDEYDDITMNKSQLNCTTQELPLILAIEFDLEPCGDTDWLPINRTVYLLPSGYEEKQRWVAALESVINSNVHSSHIKHIDVLGNVLLRVNRMEITCATPLNDQIPDSRIERVKLLLSCSDDVKLLLGTRRASGIKKPIMLVGSIQGLHAVRLTNESSADNRKLLRLNGLDSVHSIEIQKSLNLLIVLTGYDRSLVTVDLSTVESFISQQLPISSVSATPRSHNTTKYSRMSVLPRSVTKATGCTVFSCTSTEDGFYMAVATCDSVILYKYQEKVQEFCVRREIPIGRACSCLYLSSDKIIFGTDKFYQLDLFNYNLSEFLDKTDSTLQFAVFGAAQYSTFPLAVLCITAGSTSNKKLIPEEYLLCFHEFGVFVDGNGRRTRKQNIKWTGLPLAFAYREPYLYTVHYNAVQIFCILNQESSEPVGMRTFVSITNAQYLGPAIVSGAVYIGSTSFDQSAEVICIRGNQPMSEPIRDEEAGPGIVRKSVIGEEAESGFVSQADHRSSRTDLVRTGSRSRPVSRSSSAVKES